VTARREPEIRCPHCSGRAAHLLSTRDYRLRTSEERFDYFRCDRCRSVSLAPVPPDLDRYYPDSYLFLPGSTRELPAILEPERVKLDLVRRFRPGGRLLDVGAGQGGFAYLAKRAGYDVEAIEADPRCCRFMERTLGLAPIQSDDVVAALRSTGQFEVITLWHVIEHLSSPMRILEALARRLAPEGILVVATPNPDSLQFKLFKERWVHLDPPRHLQLLPLPFLVERAEALDLAERHTTTVDPAGLGWNRFGWRQSIKHPGEGGLRGAMAALLAPVASAVAGPLERRGLAGSTYTVVLEAGRR
jgi:2-polyprenyl-3-methyl-5-hydroxy-6-metoxy-1,4-benzoquinol methylase